MADLEVDVKNIEATRLSDDEKQNLEVTFSVSANLTETERNSGRISLKFSIDLESQPAISKLAVSGSATIVGEDQEIEKLLAVKDAESTPAVFMKIYEKVYAILYLLCGSLKIPYPSPALLRSVQVSSATEQPRATENKQQSATSQSR